MAEIDTLRGEIDDITIQMIKLLKKRTSVSRQIGTIKGSSGKNVLDEEREEQLRTLVLKACSEIELDDSMGTRLLNFLLNESVKVQSDSIPQSSHLAIFAKAKEMEKNGTEIIHMEVGEPDFSPPSRMAQVLSEACERGRVKYGTTQGDAEFREKISKHASLMYDVKVSPKDVLVTAGARFAIYLAMQTLLEQGDEVIIIEPAWPAYSQCAINVGAKARIVRTTIENRWEPSLQDIKSKINSNTKMIILNYPNNPTGKILGDDLLDSIINVAKENNLYVLSDEIYSQFDFIPICFHMVVLTILAFANVNGTLTICWPCICSMIITSSPCSSSVCIARYIANLAPAVTRTSFGDTFTSYIKDACFEIFSRNSASPCVVPYFTRPLSHASLNTCAILDGGEKSGSPTSMWIISVPFFSISFAFANMAK